jgi:Transposase, Mutator family
MTGHPGYDKHDPAGRGSGNNRNGSTGKTVLTDVGAVDLAVPRDRNGTFEPQIVRKGQTRLKGFNERIIALYARGMTTRDIRAHLREIYGVDVSPDLISQVTDGCWKSSRNGRPGRWTRVYPVVFIDALMVKIRVLSLIVWAWLFDLVRLNCDHAPGVLSLRSCCRICRLCVSSGCAGIRAGWCSRPGSAGRRRRAAGAGRCPGRSMAATCASCGTPRPAACRW